MPALGKTRVTVEIDDELFVEFKVTCAKEKESMAEIIRGYIKDYVESKKRAQIIS
jgi:metal-responsive CopG/Arc/MetJ family transcriptional regulator